MGEQEMFKTLEQMLSVLPSSIMRREMLEKIEHTDPFCGYPDVIRALKAKEDGNVKAVFDLILDAAVRNNVPQEELPETLYLISDMEFNACVRNASVSNFASAKRRFAEHGYRLPQIVFWNVASRNSNQPVTKNEQGVALVSGCTPRLFSMVASGDLSPYSVMMDIIESERYAKISA